MTSNVPATQAKTPMQAGGQVAALIPQNLEQAFRVANAFAVSGLAPQSLKTPEAILVAIMAGAELGFAPYQAMQSFAVINGRASIWGDAIPALLWSRGFDIEEWFDNDDDATKAFCKVTRPSGKVIERTFSLKDAREALLLDKQGPWKTARKRMLQMRARAFAARDGAADVLRGMPVYEEVQDYQVIREAKPEGSGLMARLAANRSETQSAEQAQPGQAEDSETVDLAADLDAALDGDTIPDHDTTTGEIIEQDLPGHADEPDDEGFPGDRQSDADEFDVQAWARGLIADDTQLQSVEQIEAFFADKEATRRYRALEAAAPVLAKTLVSALNGRKKALRANGAAQ